MNTEAGVQRACFLLIAVERIIVTDFSTEEVDVMRNASIVSVILIFGLTSVGLTGPNASVRVAVHVLPRDCDRGCSRKFPEISDPCNIKATQEGCGDFDFFPVFYDLNECLGVQYAVVWPGSYSCIFSMCAFSHIGEIVWPGDWIAQCFEDCQTGFSVIPGWGWITVNEPGRICIAPDPFSGQIKVLDCSCGQIDNPVATYCAGVCGAEGDDPCTESIAKATEATTWGAIKGMFR